MNENVELLKRWMQIHEAHASNDIQRRQSLVQQHCQDSADPLDHYNTTMEFLARVTAEEAKAIVARAMKTIKEISRRKSR